ncbi:MAG: recombinase family protein [Clostridia bacterium]|nr:recombinase family protein [Clostridia bacterium]
MNVVAYCRVSTDEKDQLNSLQTQKDFFEAYASKNGMNLIKIYSDQGISGTKTKNRAAFNQMMHDAETKIFDAVLIKDVSRLARNTVVLLEACRKLRALDIEVQFLNYRMNNMGNSEFLLTLYAAMAQEESYNTSKRIKFSKKFNAEKGKVPNFVFGYDKIKGDYFHLHINENEANTVRQIFEWYTQKGDGTLKIAQKLNTMGIPTKRGCKWTQNAVARILTNAIYIGKIINGKQELVNFPESKRIRNDESALIIVQNEDLRIIDDKTFEKAEQILKERQAAFHTDKIRHSNRYLFSTLIRCKECGFSFRRTVRTYRNTYIRWVCSSRNGHGTSTCENMIVLDEDILLSEIQNYFSSLLQNKKFYIETAMEIFRKEHEAHPEQKESTNEIRRKLSEMKKYKEKMLQLFTADLISLEEFQARTLPIKTEISRLENALQSLCGESPDSKTYEKALHAVFQNIEQITDIRALSNAEIKKIIHEITVDKDGNIDIYLNVFREEI